MRRTAIHLGTQQVTRLRLLSNGSGLSIAELIRRAIDEFVDRQVLRQSVPSAGAESSRGD